MLSRYVTVGTMNHIKYSVPTFNLMAKSFFSTSALNSEYTLNPSWSQGAKVQTVQHPSFVGGYATLTKGFLTNPCKLMGLNSGQYALKSGSTQVDKSLITVYGTAKWWGNTADFAENPTATAWQDSMGVVSAWNDLSLKEKVAVVRVATLPTNVELEIISGVGAPAVTITSEDNSKSYTVPSTEADTLEGFELQMIAASSYSATGVRVSDFASGGAIQYLIKSINGIQSSNPEDFMDEIIKYSKAALIDKDSLVLDQNDIDQIKAGTLPDFGTAGLLNYKSKTLTLEFEELAITLGQVNDNMNDLHSYESNELASELKEIPNMLVQLENNINELSL